MSITPSSLSPSKSQKSSLEEKYFSATSTESKNVWVSVCNFQWTRQTVLYLTMSTRMAQLNTYPTLGDAQVFLKKCI